MANTSKPNSETQVSETAHGEKSRRGPKVRFKRLEIGLPFAQVDHIDDHWLNGPFSSRNDVIRALIDYAWDNRDQIKAFQPRGRQQEQ